MTDLSVRFCGVDLKNPVVVGSSELTLSAANMRKCVDAGAGGLVAKTLTDSVAMREQTAGSKWRFLDEHHRVSPGRLPREFSFYGRSGLAEEPPSEWAHHLRAAVEYAQAHEAVVIGSVAGTEPQAWAELAKVVEDTGVPLIEMNFGCPHPSEMVGAKTGMVVGQDPQALAEAIAATAEAVTVPLIAKLTPQVTDMVEMARCAKEAGASAVTLTNRFMGFAVNTDTARPHIYGWAGIGGPWVKPLSLRWVSKTHVAMPDLPITGSNGVYDGTDVVEFIMSGASIVQICSAVMLKGYPYIERVVAQLQEFMRTKGYSSPAEMVGLAARAALTYEAIKALPPERAEINRDLCTDCGICQERCYYDSIAAESGGFVITETCRGCGICSCVCPQEAISVVGGRS